MAYGLLNPLAEITDLARQTVSKENLDSDVGGTIKIKSFVPVKGKPRESVGRKATGLSLGTRYGSRVAGR